MPGCWLRPLAGPGCCWWHQAVACCLLLLLPCWCMRLGLGFLAVWAPAQWQLQHVRDCVFAAGQTVWCLEQC